MAIEQLVPLLFILGLGLFLKWRRVLKKEHAPLLSQLILHVCLPATILSSLWSMHLSASVILLPVCGLLIVVVLLGVGFLLAPLLGLEGKTRGAFLMAFPSLELGSIGYACMLAVYGPEGLAQIALLDLGNGLFFFTVVAYLASRLGHASAPFRIRTALIQFLKNPMLWSYGVGLGLNLLHVRLPLLSYLLTPLAQALLLLILLFLAVEIELRPASLRAPLCGMYVKLAAGMTIGMLVAWLFGLTGITRVAVVLGAALPCSFLTIVYAQRHALDAPFLASMVSLALPVSIGWSALLLFLVH